MESINNDNVITTTESQRVQGNSAIWPWVLGGALLLSLGANVYQSSRTNRLNADVDVLRQEITGVKSTVSSSQETVKQNLATVQDSLTATKEEMAKKVDLARIAARQSAAVVDAKLTKTVNERDQKLSGEMQQIRETAQQATDANGKLASGLTSVNGEVGAVKTDVGAVKADVASTRSELERTIADLKRMRGDMGEMSGLIATNGKELSALRELGDRVYWEFSLPKSGLPQKVGDIQIALKKLDAKRNRYTVDVAIDDKHIEKRDRTINEPVQFYSGARSRQPMEVVVYEIDKDKVVGYLASPKVQVARK